MKKIIFLVCMGASLILAGCSFGGKKTTVFTSTGALQPYEFSYEKVRNYNTYPFIYDTDSDSYVAVIPELKVKITVPPTHALRGENESTEYIQGALASGLTLSGSVIDGQIAFFDKDPQEGIQTILQSKYNVPAIPECQFTTGAKAEHDTIGLLSGTNIEYYTIDIDAFSKSEHIQEAFMRGIDEVCGDYAANYTRIYYDPAHPDRYMQSMTSVQSVELLNAGTYIEYTE